MTSSLLSEEARALLNSKVFAFVALNDGGRPHVTPVWVEESDGRVLINAAEGRVKSRVLQVGVPVAISAVDPENPYRYIQVRGRVIRRTHEGADQDIDRLAHKYLGVDTYPYRTEGEQRVTFVIEPEQVTGL